MPLPSLQDLTSVALRAPRSWPLLLAASLPLPAPAQAPAAQRHIAAPPPQAAHPAASSAEAQRSPRDWAVLACNHEVEAVTHEGPWLRYRTHVVDNKGDRTRLVIESKQGSVARTILRDGKPLAADEDAAERKRLQDIADSPTAFEHHIKSDDQGRKLAVELIHVMPDAMIYTPVPNTDNTRGPSGRPLLIFDYQPNPKWNPPTTTSEALTGLRGRVWVDDPSGWVVRMTGEIFRPVNFGWGVLARLYPGGTVAVEQAEAPGRRWIYRYFEDNLRLRALMLKTVETKTVVTASDFQLLPGPMSYQQAIADLLRAPAQ